MEKGKRCGKGEKKKRDFSLAKEERGEKGKNREGTPGKRKKKKDAKKRREEGAAGSRRAPPVAC